ncbi:unnamed protein product [Paramecium sonneborni]|uniref:Uncharacterized protein n=1 Tax=Paramecium sonneborni TaxID=65129 RepID=A0A8S1QZU5_9CILI|nr:unnamed protein product [Paramecium sonneborni]
MGVFQILTECLAILIIQLGRITVLIILLLLIYSYRYQIVKKLHSTIIVNAEPIKLDKLSNLSHYDLTYESTMYLQ